ncbi:MAG: fibronectin type III domain-containing protein [Faecalibacterium sp.]|nr:fibronectin type III domain-containing protein [Ruminococcus sp.]MCM1391763.1 fibronectin type III domain-containing protein [Ruminococcus sp.]MCM1485043.1 fibronectin type III domain-containing protein [Faecalibacterium sp.]
MNKKINKLYQIVITTIMAAVISLICLIPSFAATDSAFEKTLSGFPESYKPYLRELHSAHSAWKFVPLQTGLDWTAAVDAEQSNNRSLVQNGNAFTDIFKSRNSGDYNASKGTFIEKDSGFVTANKLAVSYYMDPRNFLTEEGIFQFEDLSFNSSFNTQAIENVLKGSFMANKTISYYDSKGKLVSTKEKYSTVIYNAGKTYNINPVFLAARIMKEVGAATAGTSVSGIDELYPGIYNFYNIGANDGSIYICSKCGSTSKESGKCSNDKTARILHSPAQRGLRSAQNDSGYSRPWNTPQKAINGGAQFIAEKYISKGQYTGYLQKFNVNPNGSYKVYDHQYMTDLSAAVVPGYSSYTSYKTNGWLETAFIFSIPVYNNMPAASNMTGTIQAADAKNQTATIRNGIARSVRTEPTTEQSNVITSVDGGASVDVLSKKATTAVDPKNVACYPYWGQIQFKKDSKTYKGYVYSNFLNLTTTTNVPTGNYTPIEFKTNKALELRYISSDPSIATIVNDKTIKFLKNGKVTITAYDSIGHYDVISYNVCSNASDLSVSGVAVKNIGDTTATVSFKKNSNCTAYEVYVVNTNNKLITSAVTTSTSVDVKSLSAEQNYKVYVRGLKQSGNNKSYSTYCAPVSFTTVSPAPPSKVSGLKTAAKGYDTVTLTWTKMSNITGYEIYTYNANTKEYKKLASVGSSATSYADKSANALSATQYSIRAYKTYKGSNIYSPYSSIVTHKPATITVGQVTGLTQSSSTSTTITLKWSSVKDATGYKVQKYDEKNKKYVDVATVSGNTCTIKSLTANKSYKFRVRAYIKVYTKTVYGSYSSVLTGYTGPDTVKKLTQSNTSSTAYKISWSAVKGASGYRIYKYDSSSKSYKKYKDTTSTSLTVSKLSAGTVHKYQIAAYTKKSNVTYWGSKSSAFTIATTPAKTTGLAQKSTSSTAYTLSWKAVKGATGYGVYRYDSSSKSYKKIATVKTASYKITKLSPVKTAKYKVRAYIDTSTATRWGAYSDVLSATTAPDKVKTISQSGTSKTGYTLKWSAVKGATGYRIYKYDSSSKSYKKLKDVTSTSYKITGLSAGKTAKYQIKAYIKTSTGTYWGSSSAVFTAATTPDMVKNLTQSATSTTGYTLKWKAVSGATGYRVYKYDAASKSYKKLKDVTSTSCKITGLKAGNSAKYQVKAYIKGTGGTYYGTASTALTAKTNTK